MANTVWLEARKEATIAAATDRLGQLKTTIKSDVPGIDLIQVVGPDHHVIASSPAARGLPPLSSAWPAAEDPQEDVQNCAEGSVGCVRLSALRVTSAPDSPVVYAGKRAPAEGATGLINAIFLTQGIALIILAVVTTWKVTERTLRPVEAIRAELAAINVNDLSSRVPETSGDDEIARLARTVNSTLERLEHARGRMELALNQQRQFAADASHELRTPVAGLRAQLEEAQLHPSETDLAELLGHSLRDVDRLQSIIADLLLLERVDAEVLRPKEPVDLSSAVRAEVSRRADPGRIRLRLSPDVTIDAIHTQIGRVITNLLDNAERHARHTVSVEVRKHQDGAELLVDDDGDGIALADRERIFQRFTRLDAARSRDRGGTGLGLAITRDIVQAHGGTIEVGASPTGGARFTITIPLTEPSRSTPNTSHSTHTPA
ncbi:sensor histidine kinase [Sphaerisporangium corydalis]|uniref:histidine kinase n=1 Tax=Sphaerisporangium corydalis TaxID=1441875 RepID=A0ABV9EIV9_9ACTN|nr:HAMP domain-containing sensor histidine kinase [Sphaerisporangium corydalis]